MSSLDFSTAVCYQNGKSSCFEKTLQAFDDYFFLYGRKACVVPNKLVEGKQAVRLATFLPRTAADWVLVVIKVISYLTGGIPLGMLIGKAVLRSVRKFSILPPKSPKKPPENPQKIIPPIDSIQSAIAKQEKEAAAFPHATITPDNFPFGATYMFTAEQIIPADIESDGISKRPDFAGSIFKFQSCNGKYRVTRQAYTPTTFRITHLDGTRTIDIPSIPEMEEAQKKKMLMVYIDNLPQDILGSGCLGQVYDLPGAKTPSVFKIEKRDIRGGEKIRVYLNSHPRAKDSASSRNKNIKFRDPLPAAEMKISFYTAQNSEHLISVPKNKHVVSCHGVIFVKDLNCWGIIYEKIIGKGWPDGSALLNMPLDKKKALLSGLAEGLKHLDQHGHAQTDLKSGNLMIRENGDAVVIDLDRDQSKDPEYSIESRQQFGTMLYQAFVQESSFGQGKPCEISIKLYQINRERLGKLGVPANIIDCIFSCWSDKSIQEYSWDHILHSLS